jgi:hypothetical protein
MLTVVIVLDIVLGLASLAGGAYMVVAARSPRLAWLRGSAFRSLLWPGLFLLVVCGGSLLVAAVLLTGEGLHTARLVSVEAGVMFLGWNGVMFSAAGYRHWAQMLLLVLGLVAAILPFAIHVPG